MNRRTFVRRLSSAAPAAVLLRRSSIVSAATELSPLLPGSLTGCFEAPAELANPLDRRYRSPLLFTNGTPVESAAEWPRRREEIRGRWHHLMGAWPKLLDRPRVELLTENVREDFLERRVRVEIAPSQMAEGHLLLPKGAGPRAAVFVPFYDADTSIGRGKAGCDFALQLTKRGFITLSIGSPGGDARSTAPGGGVCQPLSFLAYIAANCANALAALPEVDPQRLGVVGHSYGGKWAMFASCLVDSFACAAWSDPGIVFDETRANVNYWEPWYLGAKEGQRRQPGIPSAENPRTGAYKAMIEQGIDLHELHALMAPRPFFVSGGSEDPPERWRALQYSIAVNRLLGHTHRVGMANRSAHDPTVESNEQIYQFFEHFLREIT